VTSIIVEAGCTIRPGGGELGHFSGPGARLTPAEADRKAKPCRGRRRGRRPLSKRVPWSAETRGRDQSAGGLAKRSDLAAGVLVVHLMRNNNNDLKSNKRLKS